jgi:hypothetical protein
MHRLVLGTLALVAALFDAFVIAGAALGATPTPATSTPAAVITMDLPSANSVEAVLSLQVTADSVIVYPIANAVTPFSTSGQLTLEPLGPLALTAEVTFGFQLDGDPIVIETTIGAFNTPVTLQIDYLSY